MKYRHGRICKTPACIPFLLIALVTAFPAGAQSPVAMKTPVFPEKNPNLIFTEGEDAVSTNFAGEPFLNYGCSGRRTLQLNRSQSLQTGAAFYADYVFLAEEEGTYEFWYGGTPPGPRDDLYPSYMSPFRYVLNGNEPVPVYREQVHVVGNYNPCYYWTLVGDVTLKKGLNTLRFEVTDRRRYDNRFYFFLDDFFLIRKEDGRRLGINRIPEIFPSDLDDRTNDYPFMAIEEYQIMIRDNPKRIDRLIDLSLVYSLLGDYLSALKNLKKVVQLEPDNRTALLLIAKNWLWKEATAESLSAYQALLDIAPERKSVWMEAGKVAAWAGRYDDSKRFYTGALKIFPDDYEISINYGITNLWAGNAREADRLFSSVISNSGNDADLLKSVGLVFSTNGYPEKAAEVYRKVIEGKPDDLEAYMLLDEVLRKSGKQEEADGIITTVERTFPESPELATYLSKHQEKLRLRDTLIGQYVRKLEEHPDDLVLRETLAQTFFWNGKTGEGVEEYRKILAAYLIDMYRNLDSEMLPLLETLDANSVAAGFQKEFGARANALTADLIAGRYLYEQALTFRKNIETKIFPIEGEKEKAETMVGETETNLIRLVSYGRSLIDLFDRESRSGGKTVETADAVLHSILEKEEPYKKRWAESGWKWNEGIIEEIIELADTDFSPARQAALRTLLLDRPAGKVMELTDRLAESADSSPYGVYTVLHSLLRQEKIGEALAFQAEHRENLGKEYPFTEKLFDPILALKALDATIGGDGANTSESTGNLLETTGNLILELSSRTDTLYPRRTAIGKSDAFTLDLLKRRTAIACFEHQEKTYLIRNELGNFYYSRGKLIEAGREIRMVLEIEPTNLQARYLLGNIYRKDGRWDLAMEAFRTVHADDPLFAGASSEYNKLARQFADSLDSAANLTFDPYSMRMHAETSFRVEANSLMAVAGTYAFDAVHLNEYRKNEVRDSFERFSSYDKHDFSVKIPFTLRGSDLIVSPSAGALFYGNGIFFDGVPSSKNGDFLSRVPPYSFTSYLKFDFTYRPGVIFTMNGSYRSGPHPESLSPEKTPVHMHSGETNIFLNFRDVPVPVLNRLSTRTFGRAAIMDDDNLQLTALEEIQFFLFQGGNPYSIAYLTANGILEDTVSPDGNIGDGVVRSYWAPEGVVSWTASLGGATWVPFVRQSVLGLYVRGGLGMYFSGLWYGPNSAIPAGERTKEGNYKFEGDFGLELSAENLVFTVGINANGITQIFRQKGGTDIGIEKLEWRYWALSGRMGLSVKLPYLIAP